MNKIRLLTLSTILLVCSAAFAKININTANLDELAALKGIGVAKATAIVEYREAQGDFTSIDELNNVKGIGEKIIAKISDDIKLEGETDLSDISQ